jgi:methionine synthase II (cobalamin-independent)
MFAAIAGGYPFGPLPGQAEGFAEARRRRASGDSLEEDFQATADAWVTEIVAEQARNGLSMLADGWARWRAETPTDLARELLAGTITPEALVTAWRWADDGIDAMVKQVLPGPWSAAREICGPGASAADRRAVARDLTDVLVAAGVALRASYVPVLQLEEPGIVAIGTDEAAWDELAAVLADLCERLPDIHRSLSITGGAAHPAGHARLAALPFESLLVDVVRGGPDAWRLIHSLPAETGVIVGAVRATDPRADDPEALVWAATIAAESHGRGHIRTGISTAGSLAGIERFRARRKVEAMGTAVRLAKLGPLGHVARALQPDPLRCRIGQLRRLYEDHLAALGALGREPEGLA